MIQRQSFDGCSVRTGWRTLAASREGCDECIYRAQRLAYGSISHDLKEVITCACGNVIHTRSTKKEIHVEVCSKCHPFYTGKQKLVDTGGRVDRFKKRFNLGG